MAHDPVIMCGLLCLSRYAMEVGELSQPIVTDSGVHIIMRTAWDSFLSTSGPARHDWGCRLNLILPHHANTIWLSHVIMMITLYYFAIKSFSWLFVLMTISISLTSGWKDGHVYPLATVVLLWIYIDVH